MSESADALLKSCKELREVVRLAVLVLIGEDADGRLLELCQEQGIDGQVMIRAGTAIEQYEKACVTPDGEGDR